MPCCNIAIDFLSREVSVEDTYLRLHCWDTAGCERFRGMTPSYYRGAAAAVISYDITSQQSFEKAESWLQQLRALPSGEILIALVACKSDLAASRQVDPHSALAYAIKNECLFMETSAKTNQNVDELFKEIALRLYKPSFGSSVVLNLAIEESCGYGSQSVTITAANLAGNTVAKVEADLTLDSFDMLRTRIAEQTGEHVNRYAFVFGERNLCDTGGDVLLAKCLRQNTHYTTVPGSNLKLSTTSSSRFTLQ